MRQCSAPRIKDLNSLSSSFDLGIEVHNHRFCQCIKQLVHQLWLVIRHGFTSRKVATGTALHHVSSQCPRATGKTNQRYSAIKLSSNSGHSIDHIRKVLMRINNRKLINIRLGTNRLNARPGASSTPASYLPAASSMLSGSDHF